MSDRQIDPTRQGGASRSFGEPGLIGQVQPLTLEQAIAMVDAWPAEFGFQLHQIARVLRAEITRLENLLDAMARGGRANIVELETKLFAAQDYAYRLEAELERTGPPRQAEEDAARLGTLRRENDELRTELDAIKRLRDTLTFHEREFLMKERDYYMAKARELAEAEGRALDAISAYGAAERRALAAVPCNRVNVECFGRDYPYAPCCNLRVALLPGEPLETDYLAESGELHLFAPVSYRPPGHPRAPRKSAGCVKLIEPQTPEERYMGGPLDAAGYIDLRGPS